MIHKFLASKFSGYLAIGSILFIAVAAWYVYSKGYASCEKDQIVNTITVVEKRNEIEQEITALPDDAVTARLCKWVRGGC